MCPAVRGTNGPLCEIGVEEAKRLIDTQVATGGMAVKLSAAVLGFDACLVVLGRDVPGMCNVDCKDDCFEAGRMLEPMSDNVADQWGGIRLVRQARKRHSRRSACGCRGGRFLPAHRSGCGHLRAFNQHIKA